MDIYIDEKKSNFAPGFPLTWGDFFQKLLTEGNYVEKDHGIVKLTIDDVDSLSVMMEKSAEKVPEDIKVLHIFTKDSLSITRDGLAKVAGLIGSMKEEISAAAGFYKEGKIDEASSNIARVMEAFKPMVNFINSVGISFSLDFDEIMFDRATTLRQKIELFLETFSDLVAAQERKDYDEVAGYLEGQFLADMSDWDMITGILLKEVEISR